MLILLPLPRVFRHGKESKDYQQNNTQKEPILVSNAPFVTTLGVTRGPKRLLENDNIHQSSQGEEEKKTKAPQTPVLLRHSSSKTPVPAGTDIWSLRKTKNIHLCLAAVSRNRCCRVKKKKNSASFVLYWFARNALIDANKQQQSEHESIREGEI